MRQPIRHRPPARQKGVATLIVVMVLFFVLTMVAAYAGRNIIFEQRTSANQHQYTVAFEAADAGLEWALSMLNSSRIDDTCAPSTNLAHAAFRQRYLAVDGLTGLVTVPATVRDGPVWPSCAFVGGAWVCSCPTGAGPAMPAAPATGLAPSFRVRFVQISEPTPSRPGMVRIEVNGCTSIDDACLNFKPADIARCQGTVCALVALQGGLKSAPSAAITARGSVDFGGSPTSVINSIAGGTGYTIVAGGAVNQTGLVLAGPAGTPGGRSVVANDPGLSDADFDGARMFAAAFGVWPNTFTEQPAAVHLDCAAPCGSTALRAAIQENPGRIVRVAGSLALDGGNIGSPTDPALVVVSGSLTFSAPTSVFGFVYSQADDWTTSGTGEITGAIAAQANLGGTGTYTVAYDRDVLTRLRWQTGSFVKVPGGWKDFP